MERTQNDSFLLNGRTIMDMTTQEKREKSEAERQEP